LKNLITFTRPYRLKSINSVKDLLLVFKNILRIAELQDLISYSDCIIIPIRWSKLKNSFVVDRGTGLSRDIRGISKEELNLYFKDNVDFIEACNSILDESKQDYFLDIAHKHKLTMNENRFIAFRYYALEKKAEVVGIFNRCQTKKRSGVYHKNLKSILLNDTKSLFEQFSYSKELIKTDNRVTLKNYNNIYNLFFKSIKDKNSGIDNLSWDDLLNKTLDNKEKTFIFLNNTFVNYLNSCFNINKSFTLTDYNNNIIYNISIKEITNEEFIEESIETDNSLSLLPVMF
tara:strand:+ start:2365 stop:3228 length:864 start_codon:yes stop_codon:yes gene_type:complete